MKRRDFVNVISRTLEMGTILFSILDVMSKD